MLWSTHDGTYRTPETKATHWKLCALGRRALFAVLDVDALFPQLMPAIGRAVDAIGGSDLLAATFCTNGSDDGRGKVIVTFAEPVPASHARSLARRLRERVRASVGVQSLERHQISAYPQEKSGGVVRVLGRNAARSGPLETAFSLYGEPGLSHVHPLRVSELAKIVADLGSRVAPWAIRLLAEPWLRAKGTDKHFGRMVALAREAIRIDGRSRARHRYDMWLEEVRCLSPELSLPSTKTRDARNVLDHARDRAWNLACQKPNSWEPKELYLRKGMPRGVLRIYNALVSFVQQNGLSANCFGIDYERIAILVGASKSTAHRWVQRATEAGVLVVHDRGTRHTKALRGRCTLFGLVCRNQTLQDVRVVASLDNRLRRLLNPQADYAGCVSRNNVTELSNSRTTHRPDAVPPFKIEGKKRG